MNYDELSRSVRELTKELAESRANADDLRAQIDWFDGLDPVATEESAEAEVKRLSVELNATQRSLATGKEEVKKQRILRILSWHPTALLVKQVYTSRQLLRIAKAEVAKLTAQVAELDSQHQSAEALLAERRDEAERHRVFDRGAVAERLREVEKAVAETAPVHGDLASRLHAVDAELAPVVADLQQAQGGLRRVNSRSATAQRLKAREERLEKRIRQIKRKGTMVVETVIIDGSNLRFDDKNGKIGLFALRPLCAAILETTRLLVVFDATILRQLGYPDEASLKAAMPGVPVKVVSSSTDADEFILDLAEDENTYVLSNDTLPEYESSAAMRGDRVLAVEIVDELRLVRVPMLDLKISYVRERQN